jgi:FdrA protein
MSILRSEVRRGTYYDSLVLMRLQRALLELPGILDAGVIMATPANRELLAANGLLVDSTTTNPDDLMIVLKSDTSASGDSALAQVDTLLARRRTHTDAEFRPRSLRSAVKQLPDAAWVLVSVPGRYAAAVAREALALGRNVFLYSDNVTLEDEVSLKRLAHDRGLLVMGPDCGTAIIGGIGLGFANHVRRGAIGLVGASGTGLQAVTAHIHNLGGGISHALGTGSRDLRSEVGGITAAQGLDLLARDPGTEVIVLVSKPPSPEVATRLLGAARMTAKPIIVYFIGQPVSTREVGNLRFALNLADAGELALRAVEDRKPDAAGAESPISRLYLRGLFSGGTLAYETLLGLQPFLSPLYSNAPVSNALSLQDPLHSQAHTILDLGDEFFMVGRLHPMIDNDLRIRRLRQEASDPQVGLILLDVVLGEGAHPDPASELAPVIRAALADRNGDLEIAVILIGTDSDPQDMSAQVEQLRGAGAALLRSVNEAIQQIAGRYGSNHETYSPVPLDPFTRPVAAINVGLESFYDSLLAQGAQAVQVDWRPPAGGDDRLASLLARMKK